MKRVPSVLYMPVARRWPRSAGLTFEWKQLRIASELGSWCVCLSTNCVSRNLHIPLTYPLQVHLLPSATSVRNVSAKAQHSRKRLRKLYLVRIVAIICNELCRARAGIGQSVVGYFWSRGLLPLRKDEFISLFNKLIDRTKANKLGGCLHVAQLVLVVCADEAKRLDMRFGCGEGECIWSLVHLARRINGVSEHRDVECLF